MHDVSMAHADSGAARAVFAPALASWVVIPAILAIALLILNQVTDFDRTITRFFYDAHLSAFPLRTNFWLDVVAHHWAKYAVVTLGCVVAAGLLLSFALPHLRPQRRLLLFVLLAVGLAPLSVTAGKAASARHCPWNVEEFGGLVPYVKYFEPMAADVEPGHCFPAGHASTGFALMAFYFAAHAQRMRRAAAVALAIGIVAGLALGFGRVAQGAHFVSHVLWSGLLCWMVMVLLYRLLMRTRAEQGDRQLRAEPAPLPTMPRT